MTFLLSALVAAATGGAAGTATAASAAGGNQQPACYQKIFLSPQPAATLTQPASLADLAASVDQTVVFIESAVPAKTPARGQRAAKAQEFSGSGFIFRQDADTGYALTNYHVIANATGIKVTLADGRRLPAAVLAADEFTDLAIVKFTAPGLPVATLGSSANLRVGDTVIAIGNPLQLQHTVTAGIVSGLGGTARFIDNVQVIQTDAAINHGNSGGPLFDICGQVIGINTSKRLSADNTGFAIPIDLARDIARQLFASGKARHPWAGIKTKVQKPRKEDVLADEIVVITEVIAGTPSAQAGFAAGDIIQQIAGQTVLADDDVSRFLAQYKPGDALIVGVLRKGKPLDIALVLGSRPEPDKKPKK
jgi:S1-C subfamily serine protease